MANRYASVSHPFTSGLLEVTPGRCAGAVLEVETFCAAAQFGRSQKPENVWFPWQRKILTEGSSPPWLTCCGMRENSASEVMLSSPLGPRYHWYCLDVFILAQMHRAAGGGHVCLSWVEPSFSGCWASEKLNGHELNCLQRKAANRESTAQMRMNDE